MYFRTSKGVGRLELPMEKEDGDTHTHVFIDAQKLLHLSRHYAKMRLDNKNVFWSERDSFSFPSFTDSRLADRVRESDCLGTVSRTNEFYINEERLEMLRLANKFVDRLHPRPELRGVFARNGKLIGINKALIFETNTGLTSVDQQWSKWLVLVLLTMGAETYVQRCDSGQQYRVVNKERHIEFVIRNDNGLNPPDTDSQKFVDSYTHENKIMFKRKDITEVIRLLEGYTKFEKNDSLSVTIKPKGLEMQSNQQGIFSKSVPINYTDEDLEETNFLVSATKLKTTLTTLTSEHVEVYMDPESPLMQFKGLEEPDTHIIVAKIKES
jgi:hypothetical protein